MIIEEGKYYKRRDGRTAGPMIRRPYSLYWKWRCSTQGLVYNAEGLKHPHKIRPVDLLEEVPKPEKS